MTCVTHDYLPTMRTCQMPLVTLMVDAGVGKGSVSCPSQSSEARHYSLFFSLVDAGALGCRICATSTGYRDYLAA